LAKTTRDAKYSSKIIKAGALLPDTKLLLETWDTDTGIDDNLERVRAENLLGKSSRSRVEDVLRVFRQRYLEDPELLRALVALVKGGMPAESLERVLYFQAVRSDPLLHDLVTKLLADWSVRSDREVRAWEVQNWVERSKKDAPRREPSYGRRCAPDEKRGDVTGANARAPRAGAALLE